MLSPRDAEARAGRLKPPLRVALVVEYEGTGYHGFQYQKNAPSIQGELEKALMRLTGERIRVKAAGRTDAGVHSLGQVVVFDTASHHSPHVFQRALNSYLPASIAVKAAHQVPETFDPRRSAISRKYRYTIECGPTASPLTRRTTYQLARTMNVGRMRRAARLLLGRHDFARFSAPLARPGRNGTVREVYRASLLRRGDTVTFEVEANGFLPHQVRRTAGALVDVGLGRLTVEQFGSLVRGDAPGDLVAHSLAPHGLCLVEVKFAEFPPRVGGTNGSTQSES